MRVRGVQILLLFAVAMGAAGVTRADLVPECRASVISKERTDAVRKQIVRVRSSAVILRLTYSGPYHPPLVETIYAGGDSRYAEGLLAEARQLRTPCVPPGHALTVIQFSSMLGWQRGFESYERRLDRELPLSDVIKSIKESKRQAVQLDTRTMGCPFSLVFAPFQPYLPNRVEDP